MPKGAPEGGTRNPGHRGPAQAPKVAADRIPGEPVSIENINNRIRPEPDTWIQYTDAGAANSIKMRTSGTSEGEGNGEELPGRRNVGQVGQDMKSYERESERGMCGDNVVSGVRGTRVGEPGRPRGSAGGTGALDRTERGCVIIDLLVAPTLSLIHI